MFSLHFGPPHSSHTSTYPGVLASAPPQEVTPIPSESAVSLPLTWSAVGLGISHIPALFPRGGGHRTPGVAITARFDCLPLPAFLSPLSSLPLGVPHVANVVAPTTNPNTRHVRITAWMASLPTHIDDLELPEMPPPLTASLYHDWLGWIGSQTATVSLALENHEVKYRRLGLQYHSIPYELRHTKLAPSVSPDLGPRLASVFEAEAKRQDQAFFTNWLAVEKDLATVTRKLRFVNRDTRVPKLQRAYKTTVALLKMAEARVNEIGTQLDGVEQEVNGLWNAFPSGAFSMRAAVELTYPNGLEGGLYRKWVATFQEVADAQVFDHLRDGSQAVVHGKLGLESVASVLRREGPERSLWWKRVEQEDEVLQGLSLGKSWEQNRPLAFKKGNRAFANI